MAEEAKQGELEFVYEDAPIDPPSVDSENVRPEINVLDHKEEVVDAFLKMFELTSIKDQTDRNQAYREIALDTLVLPIWGELLDKENGQDLRRANVDRRNAQLTGMGAGITKKNFHFRNSVALGDNSFRQAQHGVISGSAVVGDYAAKGDFVRKKLDERGLPTDPGHLNIDNSALFGIGVLSDAVNGSVSNSIVGVPDGDIPKAFNVDVENTYFVTPQEIVYVKRGKFTGGGLKRIPAQSRVSISEWKESTLAQTS